MAVILLYHAVSDTVADPALQVAPATIFRDLDWLARLGFQTAPLATVLAESSRRIAAVTFDDGLSSIDATVRALLAKNIEPTLFLCPGRIGQENVWASPGRVRERLLTLAELQGLRDAGAPFGVHGWDHQAFAGRSSAEIETDLARCREGFEGMFQVRPDVFAWPFGRFDRASRAVVGSEYRHALAVEPAWDDEVSRMTIPRVVGRDDRTFAEFADEVELKTWVLDDGPGRGSVA